MKIRRDKGIALIAPRGWLMGGPETDEFEKTVRDLLESGNRCLIVDLMDVQMMNSVAIGALVGLRASYTNRGGTIKLCHLDEKMQSIFVITKLSLLFDVYKTERLALESFAGTDCPE